MKRSLVLAVVASVILSLSAAPALAQTSIEQNAAVDCSGFCSPTIQQVAAGEDAAGAIDGVAAGEDAAGTFGGGVAAGEGVDGPINQPGTGSQPEIGSQPGASNSFFGGGFFPFFGPFFGLFG